MADVVVLANDWDGQTDPVPYYATDPAACLDFNSSPAQSRSKLAPTLRTTMIDCAHGVTYNVVVCRVKPW
jgi:hypothetical protein